MYACVKDSRFGAPLQKTHRPAIGSERKPVNIGRYEVIRELGRGGMALVYLCLDPLIDRQVAIKVLPHQFAFDLAFRSRFHREARIVAALEHRAIVPIYDYGEDNDQLYLVMRLMHGGSLADKISCGPLPLLEASDIISSLAPALDFAHQQGIIHRDLKPANILFDSHGQPYLTDFGIVKLLDGQNTALTATRGLLGTPAYMSPEQAMGKVQLDGRSDIYALGIVLFEMLTGRVPFQANTPVGTAMAHVLDQLPDILALRSGLTPAIRPVLDSALAKRRELRYGDAISLALDLAEVAANNRPTATEAGAAIATPLNVPDASALTSEPNARTAKTELLPKAQTKTQSPTDPDVPPSPTGMTAVDVVSGTASNTPWTHIRDLPIWVWGVVGLLLLAFLGMVIISRGLGEETAGNTLPTEPYHDGTVDALVGIQATPIVAGTGEFAAVTVTETSTSAATPSLTASPTATFSPSATTTPRPTATPKPSKTPTEFPTRTPIPTMTTMATQAATATAEATLPPLPTATPSGPRIASVTATDCNISGGPYPSSHHLCLVVAYADLFDTGAQFDWFFSAWTNGASVTANSDGRNSAIMYSASNGTLTLHMELDDALCAGGPFTTSSVTVSLNLYSFDGQQFHQITAPVSHTWCS